MNRNCEWTTIQMKIYLLSLGAGLLVGVVYSLLQCVRPRRRWWRWSACLASWWANS